MLQRLAASLLTITSLAAGSAGILEIAPRGAPVVEIGSRKIADLEFDLSAVPVSSAITGASLKLDFQNVVSDAPLLPKRFSVSAGDLRSTILVIKGPGEYTVDMSPAIRGSRALHIRIAGMEMNAGATVSRAVLVVRQSSTAPIANAGGPIFADRAGPIRIDGSGSALRGGAGKALQYTWTIDRPAWGSSNHSGETIGREAVLSFMPKSPGYYVLKLRVVNPATGESAEDTATVHTSLPPHPRLQVNDAVIGRIRQLMEAHDPLWTRFYNRLQSHPTVAGPGPRANLMTSYLLAAAITGERAMFDSAWSIARDRMYRNGKLVSLIEQYGGDQHKAAFQGGQFIGQMALLYDWGYRFLAPGERKDIVSWLNEAAEFNYKDSHPAQAIMRNDGASVTYGLAAAAYATLGENSEAPKIFGWFRLNWDEVLKGLDIMGRGGASGEGNAYGASPTGSSFIRTANLVYYASGEDLFLSHPWFRQRLLFDAFGAYPGSIGGPRSPAGFPERPIVEQASIGGDGRRGASWHSGALRPNGLILSRRFADTPEADTWNWVYRQPEVDGSGDAGDPVAELLYYSPRPRLVKPSRLSFFDPSEGFVYIRSDWDSPDATWIAFWAGPHIDTHQHLDQGAFAIFKRRDLAPKTGHYDTEIRSSHDLAWYTRTVSSNGLLIGDPNEIFRGFNAGWGCDGKGAGSKSIAPGGGDPLCPPNDGGQRTMTPLSLSVQNAAMFEAYRDVFDVARVVSFHDDGKVVSIAADLTNAYNNPRFSSAGNRPKVNRVWRRLVYLRNPDLLLIADVVEAAKPEFEKKWLLHALDRIEIDGTSQPVSAGESIYANAGGARVVVDDGDPSDKFQTTFDLRRGFASLLVKTLFPTQFRYRLVGGREPADAVHPDLYTAGRNAGHFHQHVKDFWVHDFSEGVIPNHKSVNWAPEWPLEMAAREYIPVYGPGYGRWRIELEPAVAASTDYFLNVLQPSLKPDGKLPAMRPLDSPVSFGAQIESGGLRYTIEFAKNALDAPTVTTEAPR